MSWTSALVLLAFCAHALASCRLPNSDKATIHGTKDTYNPKETISYTCNTGFKLNDNKNTLLCLENGLWKPIAPKCKQIKCKTFEIDKGTVKFIPKAQNNSKKFNTKATITCFTGYQLRGQSIVTCGANSSWSSDLPTCERVTCPLPAVINSFGPDGRQEYEVGEQITISCQEGFELIGSSQVTCGADGQWQGLPQCRLTGAIECPEPPQVPYADLDFETNGVIKSGHMASYRCRVGKLIGASDIICTEDGTWSAPPPLCEVATCFTPKVRNGVIVSGQSSRYVSGSSVRFTCSSGWLLGPEVITCGTDGFWTPRPPFCAQWYA